MEQQPMMDQQQVMYDDPLGYMQRGQPQQQDSLLNKHLQTTEIIQQLKMLLMGYEYNEDTEEWVKSTIEIGTNEDGSPILAYEGPLMDAKDIRVNISYLQMFLNSNTYLSNLDVDSINNIMWEVNLKLGQMFYRLRHKLQNNRDLLWGMIEYPIFFALNRAGGKITLDAITKMQHSVEHIQTNQQQNQQEQKKEFKVLGI